MVRKTEGNVQQDMTGTFKAIKKCGNWLYYFFSSSCLLLKVSWKRFGMIRHYDEADIFICPVTEDHVELTISKEMISFLETKKGRC